MRTTTWSASPTNRIATAPPRLRARLQRSWQAALRKAITLSREWRRRRRSRAELATFDERMLRDIGVSRADAWREINKPFWRQ